MAYEIVSDLRWTPVLSGATDIMKWANAGPGCTSGLGCIVDGNPKRFNSGSDRDQTRMACLLRDLLKLSQDPTNWPYTDTPWEMREVEHVACEVAKYVRVRDGGSPPRQRYRPSPELVAASA